MCIIVDANVAAQVFAEPPHEDFAPVMRWLLGGNGRLVYGGKLARELQNVQRARRILVQLQRSGKAFRPGDEEVQIEESRLEGLCRSNDSHVIALARVSKARILCTGDKTLMQDFKDTRLLPRPKGCIYLDKEHIHLLNHKKCDWQPVSTRRK